MSYSLALEKHVRIARAYSAAERQEGLISSLVRGFINDERQDRATDAAALTDLMVGIIMEPLTHGETFFWSSPMCDLLEYSAKSLPDWTCKASIPIVPRGMAMLERPIILGKTRVVAFGWTTLGADKGLGLVVFAVEGRTGTVMPWAFFAAPEGQRVTTDDASFNKFALFGAAFLLLEQRIITASRHQAERHTRKRLERAGYQHEPLVRVVELRRRQAKAEHSGEHEVVDWSHQWIVSGHWRQQWYPSLNEHQPRWIMPYVKGPEDKPLKQPRAKVFAVVR